MRFIGSAERKLEKPECISPETARQCARRARSAGKSPASGCDLGQIFRDRQRVPDRHAVMGQARHQDGRRQKQKLRPRRRVVERDGRLLEIQPRHPAQQPAAQRPGGIIAASDRKRRVGHGPPRRRLGQAAAGSIARSKNRTSLRPVRQGLARNAEGHTDSSCCICAYERQPTFSVGSACGAIGAFGASRPAGQADRAPSRRATPRPANALIARAGLSHARPAFGIDDRPVGNREVPVTEEAVSDHAFRHLLHFRKDIATPQPRMLVVAPLSGHFATLLRNTVETLLADHDVYITDWHNARDVAVADGRFGFDDYVDHLIRFLEEIGPGAHVLGVCQPCVQVLAAVA